MTPKNRYKLQHGVQVEQLHCLNFINDTKYSLTLRRGANIGFLVTKLDVRGHHHLGLQFAKMEHWLSSCCRF